MDSLFQAPPRPLQFWPEPAPVSADFVRPTGFHDKHFGQWCRNLTLRRHTQCPTASPFHWYVCCGADGADCCFGVQSWVLVLLGPLLAVLAGVLAFSLWLRCVDRRRAKKRPPSPLPETTPITAELKMPAAATREPPPPMA